VKRAVFEGEKERLGETLLYFALVFRSSLKTFETVRDYLLKFTDAELIFQTKSVEYLWITKAPPKKGRLQKIASVE